MRRCADLSPTITPVEHDYDCSLHYTHTHTRAHLHSNQGAHSRCASGFACGTILDSPIGFPVQISIHKIGWVVFGQWWELGSTRGRVTRLESVGTRQMVMEEEGYYCRPTTLPTVCVWTLLGRCTSSSCSLFPPHHAHLLRTPTRSS